jgi:hypothetical protein
MSRIVSIHEYELKLGADAELFERAIGDAEARGLLRLPGLTAHCFVRGLKGARSGRYAAIWTYESREAWERLWGPPGNPKRWHDYPESWRTWEAEVLAPFLAQHPDAIRYTAYEVLESP